MKLSRLLPTLVMLFCLQGLSAQDVHFTLFDMAPLRMNPALTGAFSGTARIGGIYRGQWLSVPGGADITTPSFYGDAPIIRGFRSQDWVGVGLSFISDQAGPFNLTTNLGGLSAAYHMAVDKKADNILTLGVQYNQVQRRANFAIGNLVSEQTIEETLGGGGLTNDTDFPNNSPKEKSYNDINAGLLLRTKIDKMASLELGVAALHINSPKAGLFDQNDRADRKMTFTAHAKYDRKLEGKWSMAPALFFQTTQAGKSEILAQAWAGYGLNPDVKLNFGLGWRVGDAASILLGADYKDLRAALSYDLNLRKTATNITDSFGGFELSAYYIIKVYKKPELPPRILCPEF